jgi:hypothetical protein
LIKAGVGPPDSSRDSNAAETPPSDHGSKAASCATDGTLSTSGAASLGPTDQRRCSAPRPPAASRTSSTSKPRLAGLESELTDGRRDSNTIEHLAAAAAASCRKRRRRWPVAILINCSGPPPAPTLRKSHQRGAQMAVSEPETPPDSWVHLLPKLRMRRDSHDLLDTSIVTAIGLVFQRAQHVALRIVEVSKSHPRACVGSPSRWPAGRCREQRYGRHGQGSTAREGVGMPHLRGEVGKAGPRSLSLDVAVGSSRGVGRGVIQ